MPYPPPALSSPREPSLHERAQRRVRRVGIRHAVRLGVVANEGMLLAWARLHGLEEVGPDAREQQQRVVRRAEYVAREVLVPIVVRSERRRNPVDLRGRARGETGRCEW
jgi:hypothetical protein